MLGSKLNVRETDVKDCSMFKHWITHSNIALVLNYIISFIHE
jgi:hypothetical protein